MLLRWKRFSSVFAMPVLSTKREKRGSRAYSSLDENEYEIKRKVFAGALKKGTLESFILFFSKNVCTVIYSEES